METIFTIQARRFPVKIHDHTTGRNREDAIVLSKETLHAAQLVGQSSKELIFRLYERKGYTVLEIGKPEKREIVLNLDELYRAHSFYQLGQKEV